MSVLTECFTLLVNLNSLENLLLESILVGRSKQLECRVSCLHSFLKLTRIRVVPDAMIGGNRARQHRAVRRQRDRSGANYMFEQHTFIS